jgi:dTDP-4-amino-4,6-dideoxygalactose transaminase
MKKMKRIFLAPPQLGREVAEDLFNRGLCLPSGTAMTNADLDRIISIIRRCHK